MQLRDVCEYVKGSDVLEGMTQAFNGRLEGYELSLTEGSKREKVVRARKRVQGQIEEIQNQ